MEAKQNLQKMNELKVVVNGRDLPISERQAVAMCKAIKNHSLDSSTRFINEVIRMETGIRNEGGRVKIAKHGVKYHIKTAKVFSKLFRSLSSNASVKGIDPQTLFVFAKADKAARPQRPGNRNRRFKRAHVTLTGFSKVKAQNPEKKEEKK